MDKLTRRDFLRISSSMTAGALLVACAPATVPAGEEASTEAGAATTAGESAPAGDGTQVLRKRVPNAFTNILPNKAGGEDRDEVYYAFAPPYWLTPDGGTEPGFALSHVVSDDQLTWTLNIDPAAVFSNGKPITAQAVKQCWEWGLMPDNAVSWGGSYLLLKPVIGATDIWEGNATTADGFVVVDDRTLEIKFSTIPYGWEGALSQHYLGVFDAEEAVAKGEDFLTNPVTSGPYLIMLDAGTGVCTMERNPQWWREAPNIERYETVVINDDQAALIAFENGEVDILMAWFQLVQAAQEQFPDLMHVTGATPGIWFLDVNSGLAPTDDVWVRRALMHSIDRRTAVEQLSAGSINPVDSILNDVFPCFNPDQTIPYDPDLAREELAKSSYGSAENVPPIRAYYPAGRALWGDFLTFFQDQWSRELGLQVEVSEWTGPRPDDWNLFRASFGASIPDESYYLTQMFGSTGAQAAVNKASTPELDALFAEADTMHPSQQAERCELYRQAETMVLEDGKNIPLGTTNIYMVIQPWVQWDEAAFPWPYLLNWTQWRVERA